MSSSIALPPPAAIIRRALAGQLLFSAGHGLTSGGFLLYFADPFFKSLALGFSLLLVIPEAAESLGILTRWVVSLAGSRKTVWWSGLLMGRLAAGAIPALVACGMTPDDRYAARVILGLIVVWYMLQGLSFTAYLSWLSDLVPEVNWGRLLSRRSLAISLVTLVSTLIAAATFDASGPPDRAAQQGRYQLLFTLGGGLCLLSIVPMLRLPDVAPQNPARGLVPAMGTRIREAFTDRQFRRFLLGCWQLSFFQGLMQSPNYVLSAKLLKVTQLQYYALSSVMLALQIPFALLAGRWVDRGHDRRVMVWGLLGVSLAMGGWELATWYGPRWLIPAYLIWGGFGLVNVAQSSLAWKLAPRSDNTAHLALYRQWGGLLAAMAGVIGGLLMQRAAPEKGEYPPMEFFRGIIFVSWIGRATAAFWFMGPPPPSTEGQLPGSFRS